MLPRVALAKAMRQIFYWIKILAVSFRHVNILLNWWPKPVSPDAVTFAFVCYDWLQTQIGQKFILKRFVIAATWLATFWPFVACPCKLFFKRVCRLLINFFFSFFSSFSDRTHYLFRQQRDKTIHLQLIQVCIWFLRPVSKF